MRMNQCVCVVVLLLVASVVGIAAWKSGWHFDVIDRETVAMWVDSAGAWGPAAIIGPMTVAVVASPIPSAPIALAAGAAYDTTSARSMPLTDSSLAH